MQRRLIQTKAYYKLSYSVWKGTPHKPLEVAAAKSPFPSVCTIDTTCFDECFLFHVTTGRHYFLYKFVIAQRFGTTAMLLLRSLKQVFWKKSVFYISYPHSNIAMLLIIPKHQNKTSKYFLNVLNNFSLLIASFTFSLWMFHIFLYKWNFPNLKA